MEIDFMGLNSVTKYDGKEEQRPKDAFTTTDRANLGVETSLSLSTRPSPYYRSHDILIFSEKLKKNKKWAESSSGSGGSPTGLRKTSKIPAVLYSASPNHVLNHTLPEKAENSMYIAENKAAPGLSDHSRICTRAGYTPTVAMARRATLARFLEKRLHRMNQAKTSYLTGNIKSLHITTNCDTKTVITRRASKWNNNLKR